MRELAILATAGVHIDCVRIVVELILATVAALALTSPGATRLTVLDVVSNVGQLAVAALVAVGSVINIAERRAIYEQLRRRGLPCR
jgi:hypothetical protein